MFLGTAKLLGALVLAATLALCSPHPAMAARSMGRAGGGGFSSSRSSSSRGSSSRSSHGSSSRSSSSHGSSSRSSSSLGSSSRSSSSGSSSHSSYSSGGSPSRSSHSSRPSSSTWSSSLSSSPSVSSWSSESTTTWASPSPSYHRSQSSRRLANAVIDSLFGDGSPRAQSQATWQKQEQGTEQPRPNVAAGKTSEADKTTEAGKTAEADKTAKADETKEADETSEWVYWLVGLVLFVSLLCVLRVLMTEDHGARRWGEKVGLSGDGLKVPLAAGGVQTYMSGADMRNMITIIKIQVAILGQAKSVQLQMDKLCEAADTSSKEGLHNLLTETLVVMLRHTAYWAYGNAQASAMGYDAAEMKFQQIALEERSKAEQETLVNKAGTLTKLPSIRNPDDEPLPNEYIVVTILAAIKGGLGLPESAHGAPSREKVRGAIQALSQVKADDVEVLEVLWVPQEDDDTLTHAELIENFTDLSPM